MTQDSLESLVLEGQLSRNLAKYSTVIQKFTTLSQVNKLQHVLSTDHASTTKSLDSYIQETHSSHNQDSRKLELQRAGLTTTLSKFHSVLEGFSRSNALAKQISRRITSVDNERDLVSDTLTFVEQVLQLKRNISMVHSALQKHEYAVAAQGINDIRQLPKQIIASDFAKKVVPSSEIPDDPEVLLDTWVKELSDVFLAKFLEAAKRQDVQGLTMFFQMFPLIGKPDLGLDSYSKYVCDIIAEQSRKIMTTVVNRGSNFYAQALLHLFKIVSTIINDHSKIIAKYYGKKHMVHIMTKVEKEADMQAGLILDTFNDGRKIDRIVKEIIDWEHKTVQRSQSPNEGTDEEIEDPITISELTNLINEYSSIFQNWSMYCRFFAVKWNEFSGHDLSSNTQELQVPAPIADGKFSRKINEQGGIDNFRVLVKHHLYRSFERSVELEDLPSLNPYISLTPYKHDDLSTYAISSIVEDTTLFVRSNLISNVNTGQTVLLTNFLDTLLKFIQNEYLVKFLQNKLKLLQPRLNASLALKRYVPPTESSAASRAASPSLFEQQQSKLSNFGFNFKGAATSALTNIQSNLHAVYADEESVLKLHHYLIYINTLGIGGRFFHRLLIKEILEENPRLLYDNFPFASEADALVKKIKSCEETVITQNSKLLTWSIRSLFENILQGKLKKLGNPLFINGPDDEYICSAHDFEDLSRLNQFIHQWKMMIIPFENVLYRDSYIELLTFIVEYLVGFFEAKIWGLRINELGAIKLERELSALIATVCTSNYFLRDKFAKLTQILLILGFDDDDFDTVTGDIKEEVVGTISWVLTPQERVMARKLRVDSRH